MKAKREDTILAVDSEAAEDQGRALAEALRATRALRESEEKLRAQYQGMPIPTYTWQWRGEDFVSVDYNEAALEFTLGAVADFVGVTARELYQDRPDILEDLSRCFSKRTSFEREMSYRFQTTGETKHLAVKYAFVPPDLVLVHTEDITERVQTEEALRSERDVLHTIMENTHAHLAYLDPEFNFVRVNSAYAQGSGHSKEDLLGRNHFDLFPNPENQAIFERVRDTGQAVRFQAKPFEYVDQPERGTTYWDWTLAPVTDKDGRVHGLVLSLLDVTERERAEQGQRKALAEALEATHALRESEETARALLNAPTVLAALVDPEGAILDINETMVKQFGRDRNQLMGVCGWDLIPQEVADCRRARFREALESGAAVRFEDERAGTWFDNVFHPILDAEGEISKVAVLARDVTRHKKAELALQRAHEELEQRVEERTAELRGALEFLELEITERRQTVATLRRTNRALKILSECNEALSRAQDESSLLHDVCQIAVEIGGYRFAWAGYAEQDEGRTVRPVAQAGFEEGYLETANITWADTRRGRGPTGTAIRTGEPVTVRNIPTEPDYNPWRAEAMQRGYASSIALPLPADPRPLGALNIYAAEPDAFGAEEISLLGKMADNLAYGIKALRARAEQNQAERKLAQVAEELARAITLLSALNQMGLRLQTTLDPDQLLTTLGSELGALGLECLVALLEPEGEALVVRYACMGPDAPALPGEESGDPLDGYRIPCESWPVTEVLTQRHAVYVPDVGETASALASRLAGTSPGGSLQPAGAPVENPAIFLPLAVEERLIGIMGVWGTGLGEADVAALSVFAAQVAIAFERARLTREAAEAEILREVDRLRSELIANVSHEIRTPLGLIEVFTTSLLMEDVQFDGDMQTQFLRAIKDETDRLTAIVNNLLNLSRTESVQPRLYRRGTDLGQLASEVMEAMEVQLAGHVFVHDFPSTPLVAMVDDKEIEQVLRNLLSNAIRYSPDGGTITVRGRRDEGRILVCVQDEGIGIPAEEQERIFERFYRVDNETTQQVSGVGLGLAVCRGIVESHGGRIWVESGPGGGSTFCFALPVGDGETETAEA